MGEPLNLHVVCLEDSISVLIILDFNEIGDERRVLTSEHYQTKVNTGGGRG